MAINNGSVQYNGGFLPDIILYCTIVLTLSYYHWGTRLNSMKRFCLRCAGSHLNVLTISPPVWGMLRRLTCVQIFFKLQERMKIKRISSDVVVLN